MCRDRTNCRNPRKMFNRRKIWKRYLHLRFDIRSRNISLILILFQICDQLKNTVKAVEERKMRTTTSIEKKDLQKKVNPFELILWEMNRPFMSNDFSNNVFLHNLLPMGKYLFFSRYDSFEQNVTFLAFFSRWCFTFITRKISD